MFNFVSKKIKGSVSSLVFLALVVSIFAVPISITITDSGIQTQKNVAQANVALTANLIIKAFTAESAIDGIIAEVGNSFMWISARALWLSAVILNISIDKSLTLVNDLASDEGSAVNVGWRVFRDLSNMLFIFILLYISIATILQLGGIDMKKMLTQVIIVALLINFSLFFTKIVIDTANIIALGFYQQLTVDDNSSSGFPNKEEETDGGLFSKIGDMDKGISSRIANVLQIQSLYKKTQDSQQEQTPKQAPVRNIMIITFFGCVFLWITAFVLLALSLMFLIRTVSLVLLMVTAPLAYLGSILPSTRRYSNMWWSNLVQGSLFAPIIMLMLLVVFKIAEGLDLSGGAGLADALTSSTASTSSVEIIFNFMIIIALLIFSLVIAQTVSGSVAKFSVSGAKNAFGKASGALGFAGRQTFGRGAQRIAKTEPMKNFVAKMPLIGGLAQKGFKGVAGSSFDFRGNISGASGFGKAVDGGFTAASKARTEKLAKEAKGNLNAMGDRTRKQKYFSNLKGGSLGEFFSGDIQKGLYKEMSTREKVELGKAGEKLDTKLNIEEREKTEDARKKVREKESMRMLKDSEKFFVDIKDDGNIDSTKLMSNPTLLEDFKKYVKKLPDIATIVGDKNSLVGSMGISRTGDTSITAEKIDAYQKFVAEKIKDVSPKDMGKIPAKAFKLKGVVSNLTVDQAIKLVKEGNMTKEKRGIIKDAFAEIKGGREENKGLLEYIEATTDKGGFGFLKEALGINSSSKEDTVGKKSKGETYDLFNRQYLNKDRF